ncbi:MAG: hypothetical protein L3J39_06040 [Verrucomicrobiales bacterium]|nr:hypothetical protein [Verrucomicrobiales bacterium]
MRPQSPGAPRRRKKPPRRKKPVAKKTSAAASSIRAGYRPPPKSDAGISVFTVLLMLVALAMAGGMVMVILPKDLSSIAGYTTAQEDQAPVRNVLRESLDTLVAQDKSMDLSEKDMNRYLQKRVVGKQGGFMGNFVKFKGVFVDFKKGYADVYVERSVFNLPFTMSCKVRMEKFKRKFIWKVEGGSIGRLEIPGLQFQPILKVFNRLALTCEDELEIFNKMGDIQFEEDRMVLNPRG